MKKLIFILLTAMLLMPIVGQAQETGDPIAYWGSLTCGLDYNTNSFLGDIGGGGIFRIADKSRLIVAFGGYTGSYNTETGELAIEENVNLQAQYRQGVWKGLSFQVTAGGERVDNLLDNATPITYATSGASAVWTFMLDKNIQPSIIFGGNHNFGQNSTKFFVSVEVAVY